MSLLHMSRLAWRAGDLPRGTQLVREPGLELGSAQPQTELLATSLGCLLTKRGLEGMSPCANPARAWNSRQGLCGEGVPNGVPAERAE